VIPTPFGPYRGRPTCVARAANRSPAPILPSADSVVAPYAPPKRARAHPESHVTGPTAVCCGSGGGDDVVGWASRRGGVQAVEDAQRGTRPERQSGDLRGRTEDGPARPRRGLGAKSERGLPHNRRRTTPRSWTGGQPMGDSLIGALGNGSQGHPSSSGGTAPSGDREHPPQQLRACEDSGASTLSPAWCFLEDATIKRHAGSLTRRETTDPHGC
jgi:hypothetical protein